MDISPFFFYLFGGVAIAASLLVVLLRNPVSCAFSLVLAFFSSAALYALLGAHLIAGLQILVYTGAVMVLFVFVIMLLNADQPSMDFKPANLPLRIVSGVFGVALIALLITTFKGAQLKVGSGPHTPEAIEAAGGNTRVLSELMFSEYILPFELTSILLLAVIVGVVAIAMRKRGTTS